MRGRYAAAEAAGPEYLQGGPMRSAVIIDAVHTPMGRGRPASADRPAACAHSGDFAGEIAPIEVPSADGPRMVTDDETIRPDTTAQGLAKLASAFRTDELAAAWPTVGWHTTAGDSSQITDGAAAMLVMEDQYARSLRRRTRLSTRRTRTSWFWKLPMVAPKALRS